MPTRRTGGARGALVPLMLLVLLIVAPAARAADPDAPTDTADGWKNVVSYARCAFLVFVATTPTSWATAFFDCTRTFVAEPAAPGGGG